MPLGFPGGKHFIHTSSIVPDTRGKVNFPKGNKEKRSRQTEQDAGGRGRIWRKGSPKRAKTVAKREALGYNLLE